MDIYSEGNLMVQMIKLPEYWQGLVDYDTITVQLHHTKERHFHVKDSRR